MGSHDVASAVRRRCAHSRFRVRNLTAVIIGIIAAVGTGCSSPLETVGLGVGVTTAALSRAPSHDLQQVYYLGVFDPYEQVPTSLYRVSVRGQASFMSATNFASGWVPAELVDSLSTRIRSGKDGMEFTRVEDLKESELKTGRGLMLFGPQGFRPAPRDHRLVIVMGSDPSDYFQAIDEVLGEVALAHSMSNASVQQANNELVRAMLVSIQERERLQGLRGTLEVAVEEMPTSAPAGGM